MANSCSFHENQFDTSQGEISRPLVSVIVPVYKVEEFLSRCLDSLCRQSLEDIEIILINDASPDRCGEICEQYAAKDTRFKVIYHTENRGLSAARNTGIRQASANYLMFLDSDDWVHEDFCKAPYECAVNHHADMVMFGYQSIRKHLISGDMVTAVGTNVPAGYKTKEEAINLLFNDSGNYCWNKFYRKSLFHDVYFPDGHLYEDIGTIYKVVWNAKNIYYLPKSLYNYFSRTGSITATHSSQTGSEWLAMYHQMLKDLSAWGYPAENLAPYYIKYALSYCITFGSGVAEIKIPFLMNRLRQYKTIPKEFTWKEKILFIMLNCFPPLFDVVCNLWRKMNER